MAFITTNLPAPPTAALAPGQSPTIQKRFAEAVYLRDEAFKALVKAFKAGRRYEAEGMSLQRYDIEKLREEYTFWSDMVDQIMTNGTMSTMSFRHVIPLDN